MFTKWNIDRFAFDPFSGTHSSTVTETLTGFYDPIVRTALGESKDTFSFKMTNFNDTLDNHFLVGDKMVISHAVNTTDPLVSSDILMNGIITNVPDDVSGRSNIVRIEGNNYSETLVSAITFIDGNGLSLPAFLEQAIVGVGNFNPSFKVTWSASNPTLKSDGSAFPSINEKWYNKSLLLLLERYSQNAFTKDGDYYWYVDSNNEVIWKRQEANPVQNYNSTTDAVKQQRIKKDKSSVINFIIAKGGIGPGGRPITIRADNAISRVRHGFKPHFIVSQNKYAQDLNELDMNKLSITTGSFPTSFPFITAWDSSVTSTDAPAATEGSPVTVADEDEYAFAIVREAKHLLRDEADAFLQERGNGKLMADISFAPGKGWVIGQVVNVTIPEIGKTNNPMRIQNAEYSNSGERYTLIEDEGTI